MTKDIKASNHHNFKSVSPTYRKLSLCLLPPSFVNSATEAHVAVCIEDQECAQ